MSIRLLSGISSCLVIALLSTTAWAVVIDFQEDVSPSPSYQGIATYIRNRPSGNLHDRNFGEGASILIGRINSDGSDDSRGLFGYDISAIPAGATIIDVSLNLISQQGDGDSENKDYTINLHELTGSIIEGDGNGTSWTTGPSWNSRDINGPVDWADGGEFSATVLSSVTDNPRTLVLGEVLSFSSGPAFVTAAQNALDGSGTLYMLARATSEDVAERGLFKIHSDEPDPGIPPSDRPKLTIEYTEATVINLLIDRGTGNMTLQNNSGVSVDMIGYTMTSAIGGLDQAGWKSVTANYDFDGPNTADGGALIGTVDPDDPWTVLSMVDTNLTEAEISGGDGGSLANGASINLGSTWIQNIQEDVEFNILVKDGNQTVSIGDTDDVNTTVPFVNVVFVGGGGEPTKRSDLNFDTLVDEDDYLLYLAGLETDLSGLSPAEAYQKGDLDYDGVNSGPDFLLFKSDYDAANGAGAFAAMAASSVPEPSSFAVLLIGACGLFFGSRRRCMASFRFHPLFLAMLMVVLLAPSTQAVTINFQEDVSPDLSYQGIATYIRNRPSGNVDDRNFGQAAPVLIGRIASDGSDDSRGVFGYDISTIPAGSTIDSVTLTLYGQEPDSSSASVDYDITLHELIGSVIEGDGTGTSWTTGPSWNSRDINGPVDWADGGEFSATVLSTVTDNPATLANGDVLAFASGPAFVTAAQNALDGSGTLYMLAQSTSEGAAVRGLFKIHSDEPDPGITSDNHPLLTIEYTPGLNLGLQVNTITGAMQLSNTNTTGTVNMDYYRIASPGNSLDSINWNSLDDQNYDAVGPGVGESWDEAPGSDTGVLSEVFLAASSAFNSGDSASLGAGYNTAVNVQDLTLEYNDAVLGMIVNGIVDYIVPGDMDDDGNVTVADAPLFVQALVDRATYDLAFPGVDADFVGDVNGDNTFDLGDLGAFSALLGGPASASAVPEPSTCVLFGLSLFGCAVASRRRKQRC